MPFFVALFIYDIWSKGFNRKLFLSYVILAIVVITTFLSIILFSSMNISLDEATHYHPEVELSRKFVWFIYYAHISDHIQIYVLSNLLKLISGFCLTIFFLLPLFLLGWKIWQETLKNLDKKARFLFWAMQSAFLLLIPAFCITVDHARWFAALVFSQFLLIAYFSFEEDSLYSRIGEELGLFVKGHIFLAASLVIYCSLLGVFGSDRTFECGEFILEKLHIYKVVVQPPCGV
jgi:TRAP-type C4-dicarboxylate transport system permease small subunit